MDRAYQSGAAGSAPSAPASPSTGYPTAGNPGTGIQATKPGPYWYHMIMEELMAVIASAGITPDQTKLTQLASAIQSGKLFSASAGGTADAITAAFSPAVGSLVNGMALFVRAASANTTATPTFTPNSGTIAAKTIVKGAGAALAAGDIAGSGHWIELQYDLTLDKWVLLNPATGVAAIGFGQTAQNVTASRALSTTYTNTTTKPIHVSVISSVLASGASLNITVNGVTFFGTSCSLVGAQYGSACNVIVPPGATYSAFCSTGGNGALINWSELR